jgi:2-phosphoglycerate kinase
MPKKEEVPHLSGDATLVNGSQESFPYSKGILSQSLISSGLSMEQANQVATEIEELFHSQKTGKVTSEELRTITAGIIAKRFNNELAQAYLSISRGPKTLQVQFKDYSLPFSKSILSQSLMASGLSPETAFAVSARIQRELDREKVHSIAHDRLRQLAGKVLADEFGKVYARNYLLWRRMQSLDKPLLVFIGGAIGVGKSTISRELSHRTGVGHPVSTDTVREIMRLVFPQQLVPPLHLSGYEASQTQPAGGIFDNWAVSGFVEQSKVVLVGVMALIDRAIKENISMIINGAHLVPNLINRAEIAGAYSIFFLITTKNKTVYRGRFLDKDGDSGKPARNYLKDFENICKIQDYLIEQARKFNVPMVDNQDLDDSIGKSLRLVTEKLSQMVDITSL